MSESPESGSRRWRADLHCHTLFSPDSRTSLDEVIRACARRGIDCIAITDHNQVEGGLRLAELVAARGLPLRVIVGEEVKSTQGEIIGYFLRERIPPRLSPAETIARIREQGGLIAIPHPLDRLRNSRLDRSALEAVLDSIDIVEVLNARIHLSNDSRAAARLAASVGLPASAGSDAHIAWEIGGCYVEMPEFADAGSFLHSLRQGVLFGRTVTPLVHLASRFSRLSRWR